MHHFIHAIGHGHRGFSRGFGGGFRRGDGDFPIGRKLSSGDLQLILLALLSEQSAHGYELIRLLEERSGGFYTPSPGMVYPALTYLDEIGYAVAAPEGNRKRYTITAQGSAHLDEQRAKADAILEALARIGSRMGDVRDAFSGDHDDKACGELHRARRTIKDALRQKRGCDVDEARRIAAILDRAAAEILGRT